MLLEGPRKSLQPEELRIVGPAYNHLCATEVLKAIFWVIVSAGI